MRNYDLALRFASGKTTGTGSHIFIEGNTIYSYGYHFPIAIRLKDNIYLFNSRGYSFTTLKHKSYIKTALSSNTIIEILDCDINKKDEQIKYNLEEIKEIKEKITRARSKNRIFYYKSRIAYLKEQNKLLRRLKWKKK